MVYPLVDAHPNDVSMSFCAQGGLRKEFKRVCLQAESFGVARRGRQAWTDSAGVTPATMQGNCISRAGRATASFPNPRPPRHSKLLASSFAVQHHRLQLRWRHGRYILGN